MSSFKRLGLLFVCVGLLTACTLTVDQALLPAAPAAAETPAPSVDSAQPSQDGIAIELNDADGNPVVVDDLSRIITLGGTVTEIVFALGSGDNVVAVDSSSSYPAQVGDLPQVGYQRRLSAEGVLALDPSLILATTEAGPSEAVQHFRDAGVDVLLLESDDSVEGVAEKIRGFAKALGREAEGESLVVQLEADLAQARAYVQSAESQPRVLFIYARGAGAVSVAGQNTGAQTMTQLAGGENAIEGFEGYRPLTAEAALAAAPDVILMFTSGLQSLGGQDGLLELPGIAQTPAAQHGRIVAMDGLYLLNFGPRMGQAVLDLAKQIREEQ
ncbi:MAG: hemin ABC transporter substrate-binding protein [Caldilineaceae bacterium SB0664_bin_27]|uniref:Hemin ABC transporter substrate-binding protein n=1 Tax=Caldilineaceae bacterium SB0664_bin_27 TaxID=2605260 RepID=A0A6B0YUS4_9CHLR|nr:hemin ABC transporter substrate-binding protein [Caldilineaceae bacterium SB0664_bin_27]